VGHRLRGNFPIATWSQRLSTPLTKPPISTLGVGKSRPVLVVDDLNRPTPVAAVMPIVLAQFRQAGVPPNEITVVLASGMHAPPSREAIVKKLGAEAAAACRVVIHDYSRGLITVGQTTFGTPVAVNAEVAQSDFVVGIGGLYPNHTAGFGGGSKLVLGTLGSTSIAHLHAHHGVGWGAAPDCDLRRDLDEIASLVKTWMRTGEWSACIVETTLPITKRRLRSAGLRTVSSPRKVLKWL
jgi:nickel-dependent lactate racemase